VPVTQRELGLSESPLKPFAVAFVPLMGVLVGGLLIGFSIVEEKEDNVVSALGVTPLSRFEYIFGRSLIGVVLGLLLAVPPIYVLGFGSFDVPKIVVVTLGATFIGVILGLYIGAVANNQIEAIGVLKLAALPFSIGPLLVFFVSQKWQWTLYWIPTYWTVRGYKAVFIDGHGWPETLRLTAIGLAVSFVFLALSWRFLQRRLTMRG
jgi:ABC-2 type transport system permease protein